jgi:hypothetical protein
MRCGSLRCGSLRCGSGGLCGLLSGGSGGLCGLLKSLCGVDIKIVLSIKCNLHSHCGVEVKIVLFVKCGDGSLDINAPIPLPLTIILAKTCRNQRHLTHKQVTTGIDN